MDRPTFNALCKSLSATLMVEQWGHSHVWKVGSAAKNKVFALSTFWTGKDADPAKDGQHGIVLKVAPMSFEILTQETGISQAPYFPRGGWIRVVEDSPLSDDDLAAYVREAHRIMAGGLTKKLQSELGLVDLVAGQA